MIERIRKSSRNQENAITVAELEKLQPVWAPSHLTIPKISTPWDGITPGHPIFGDGEAGAVS